MAIKRFGLAALSEPPSGVMKTFESPGLEKLFIATTEN